MSKDQPDLTALVKSRLDAWGVDYTEDDLAELVYAYEITSGWRNLIAASVKDRQMSEGMGFPDVEPALTFAVNRESIDE